MPKIFLQNIVLTFLLMLLTINVAAADTVVYEAEEELPYMVIPAPGVLNPVVDPQGCAGIRLWFDVPSVCNHEAEGFITLSKDGKVISRIPAQNTLRFHDGEAVDFTDKVSPIEISFFERSTSLPTSEPGNYEVKIPYGFVLQGENRIPSSAITLRYVMPEPEVPDYVVSPAPGKVTDLSTITLTFPKIDKILYEDDPFLIYINQGTETQPVFVSLKIYPFDLFPYSPASDSSLHAKVSAEGNVLTLQFDQVMLPGRYYLRIYEDALRWFEGGHLMSNEEQILIAYDLEGGRTGIWDMPITPAEGVANSMHLIETDNHAIPEANFVVTAPARWTPVGRTASLIPADGSDPIQLLLTAGATDPETGTTPVYLRYLAFDSKANSMVMPLNLAAGRYTLVFASGTFIYQKPLLLSPEISYTFLLYGGEDPVATPPANSVVKSLSEITVDFTDAIISDKVMATTVTDGVTRYNAVIQRDSKNRHRLTVKITDTTITQTGVWSVCIPADIFAPGGAVAPRTLQYIVDQNDKSLGDAKITPAAGSTMTHFDTFTLHTGITPTFYSNDAAVIYRIDKKGDLMDAVAWYNALPSDVEGDITLVNAYGEGFIPDLPPGKYRLVLPKMLYAKDEEPSPEMTFDYTITHRFMSALEIDPAPGSVLQWFNFFTIKVPENEEVVSPDKSLYASLVSEKTGKEVARFVAEHYGEGVFELNNALGQGTAVRVANGEYRLDLPEGLLMTNRSVSPKCSFVYTILDESGIEGINPDEDGFTVVTLDGIVLLKNADVHQLKTLPSGLYIINSKPTLLK